MAANERMLSMLQDNSVEEWIDWLQSQLAEQTLDSVIERREHSPAGSLAAVYKQLPRMPRSRFVRACSRLLQNLEPTKDVNAMLLELIYLSAYTRNAEPITRLGQLLLGSQEALKDEDRSSSLYRCYEAIAAVLSGLPASNEVTQWTMRLADSANVDLRLKGLLLMGQVRARPQQYARAYQLFLRLWQNHSNDFSRFGFARGVLREVGLAFLIAGFRDLVKGNAFAPLGEDLLTGDRPLLVVEGEPMGESFLHDPVAQERFQLSVGADATGREIRAIVTALDSRHAVQGVLC